VKKRVFGRYFSRGGGARKALFRSLISAMVMNGKITTTKARAKAIQPEIDGLIATAKKDSISARRILSSFFAGDRKVVFEITENIAPALKANQGGVTRAIPLPPRKGDRAQMVRLEWVAELIKPEPKVAKTKKEAKAAKKEDKKSKVTKSKKEVKTKAKK
jgi:large subunit ribosomal protein L17